MRLPWRSDSRREDDGADHAGDEHHEPEQARVVGAEPARQDDVADPAGHAVEHAHDHERDREDDEERLDGDGVLEAVQHERPGLLAGGPGRGRRPLAREREERDRAHRGDGAVDQLHRADGHAADEHRRERQAGADAEHARQRDQPHGGGTLAWCEPVGRHLGPRVEQERLGDGDADGAEKDERVVAAREPAQHAEDAHQHDAEPDGGAEPAAVDDPGRGQRQRDEGDHEHHRQERHQLVRHAVVVCGVGDDRPVADPEHLDDEVDQHDDPEDHPAVAVHPVAALDCPALPLLSPSAHVVRPRG